MNRSDGEERRTTYAAFLRGINVGGRRIKMDALRRALRAGQNLLRVTGHGEPDGTGVPVGVGIHTGSAWVGSIAGASGAAADFTALGDNVNIAARLASEVGPGEILVSEATCEAARIEIDGLEKRELELKGKSEPVVVRVLRARRLA